MANIKINQLPAGTLPLTGNEILPVDQGATTVKITIDDVADYVLPYTAENVANKSQDIQLDYLSTTKYPSTKAVRDYIDFGVDLQKVTDSGNITTNDIYVENIITSNNQTDFSSAYLDGASGDSGIIGVTNTTNKRGEIKGTNITADRTYQLPDQSGTFALKSELLQYQSYTAVITQQGTAAPTVDYILQNNLGGAISFAYSNVGLYSITNASFLFDDLKTIVFINPGYIGAGPVTMGWERNSDSEITLSSKNASTGANANGLIYKATIEIRVYP